MYVLSNDAIYKSFKGYISMFILNAGHLTNCLTQPPKLETNYHNLMLKHIYIFFRPLYDNI